VTAAGSSRARRGLTVAHEADYVHGYSEREAERLRDQAASTRDLLHHDTSYPAGHTVLEIGCGVGAQTVTLAKNSPGARILSLDISTPSLEAARATVRREGLSNVAFQRADLFRLPFEDETFDHVFVCFVLEHLEDAPGGLAEARRVLKGGGTTTVIEGDHGSCYWHPASEESLLVWRCLIEVQASLGADSQIGRRLYPLLAGAGFRGVEVSPRMVYADVSRPGVMDGFVLRTIVPMVETARERAFAMGLADAAAWRKGIGDLRAVAERPDGAFCYTFFKATGVR